MPEPEERLPCPVCLGVMMTKRRAAPNDELTLDRCERCGGIWFDAGEVAQLRALQSSSLWRRAVLSDDAFSMSCHSCHNIMDRNAASCRACDWTNVIDCPRCTRVMERREVQGLHLDVCTSCPGVWFDRIELAEIWNLKLDILGKKRAAGISWEVGETVAAVGAETADFLLWNPDVAIVGARAVGHGAHAVASVASEVVGAAPEALGTAVEVTGELAGDVFEAIADIIGSLFG